MLAPNEPRVDIEHVVRQARREQHQRLFQIFSRQGANEIQVASVARWEEHLRMLTVLDRKCLDLSEMLEQLSETPPETVHENISQELQGVGGAEVNRRVLVQECCT